MRKFEDTKIMKFVSVPLNKYFDIVSKVYEHCRAEPISTPCLLGASELNNRFLRDTGYFETGPFDYIESFMLLNKKKEKLEPKYVEKVKLIARLSELDNDLKNTYRQCDRWSNWIGPETEESLKKGAIKATMDCKAGADFIHKKLRENIVHSEWDLTKGLERPIKIKPKEVKTAVRFD